VPEGLRPDPPSRCCRLVFSGHYGGAPWANVMWLYLTGSGEITSADLDDLADGCYQQYRDYLLINQHEFSELQDTKVTLYSDGDAFNGNKSSSDTGSASRGDPLPSNVALCISWRIAPSYRGGHPRTYISGIPEGGTASVNSFEATYLTSWIARAEQFHVNVESLGPIGDGIETVEHGIVSFVRDGEWRTPPVFYRINGWAVDGRIDTQRRRLGPDFP